MRKDVHLGRSRCLLRLRHSVLGESEGRNQCRLVIAIVSHAYFVFFSKMVWDDGNHTNNEHSQCDKIDGSAWFVLPGLRSLVVVLILYRVAGALFLSNSLHHADEAVCSQSQ